MFKIKEIFLKIFCRKKEIIENKVITKETTKDDFINEMKNRYESSEEYKNDQLFRLYKAGEIKDEELNDDQKEIIAQLYLKDIKKETKKLTKMFKK
ncbi:MAG: hypothetical protein IJO08_04090 [Clostridia bacterium]|nr:hypothetical protein [Clostridia bacterium]